MGGSQRRFGPEQAECSCASFDGPHGGTHYFIGGMIRCGLPAKGAGAMPLQFIPKPLTRIRAYLDVAGHGADLNGPMFRPLHRNRRMQETRRAMHPDAIDRVLRKHARPIGLDRGYSAHSMRATFIITTLENRASLEDVQKAAGHRDPAPRSFTTGAAITRRNRLRIARTTKRTPLAAWPPPIRLALFVGPQALSMSACARLY
jgi:hypothetical protein